MITDFICDECKKEITGCKKFPYEQDWVYLYEFSFKKGHNLVPGIKDKHFCSDECMIKFITKQIKGRLTALFG